MHTACNVEVLDIAEEGGGVGKSDGLVIFIDHAVPGDVVDVAIRKKKKNFAQGSISHMHKASPHRTTPFCKHFYVCGGCKWQHIDYKTQLEFKQKAVCDALERIGKIDASICESIVPSYTQQFYRNKLEFTFSNRAWIVDPTQINRAHPVQALGFHIPGRFDKILNIEECFLQTESSNEIRNTLRDFAQEHHYTFYDAKNHTGELRNLIIRTSSIGELMVAVIFAHVVETRVKLLMDFLKDRFSNITSLLYVINQKKNDTLFDQDIHLFAGRDHIFENMPQNDSTKLPLKFKIGLKSFYQTNSRQAHELYKVIADFANIQPGDLVYDLYTGAGTIANFMAHRAKQVIGIDCVDAAIKDAVLNSDTNGITNTLFYSGDMKDILNMGFVQTHGKPDVIITDPPRAGMHPDVIACLCEIKVPKIIYVSCNVSTQARDLTFLTSLYNVQRIKPVDMFPHTQHIENVILLTLK